MRITFEGVGFSYHAHSKKKKRNDVQNSSPSQDPSVSSSGWGNSAHKHFLLHDITFEVGDKEFLGVIGHTGSGKSTLIQLMNGLIRPDSGHIAIDGHDLREKQTAQDIHGKVGLVFQYPEHQLFAPTVAEDVAFGPQNMGVSGNELATRVDEALQKVGLEPSIFKGKSPFSLSGGQQRLVAIAGVLAMQPQALVLDEPLAGLDPLTRKEFLGLIAKLHGEGRNVVMVSHSMEDIASLADRVLVLNQGGIALLGRPEEVFTQKEKLHRIGLDAPAAQKLAEELVERGIPLAKRFYGTQEQLLEDILSIYRRQRHG